MPTLNPTVIDYASVVWGGCSDALKKRLNSLLRRSGKLILPDKNLTTDQKHKQLDYNKGVFMYRALTNNAPVYISSLYKAPHSSSRNNYPSSVTKAKNRFIQNKHGLFGCPVLE